MDNGASSYRRFLDGDDKGLEELVRDYKDGLMLYLNGLVGDLSTAEELMEETFFKLITKRPRFKADYSFKTWLYTIGRNVAIDHLRRHAKRTNMSPEEAAADEPTVYDLETSYIAEEQKRTVLAAMKRLHTDYRQVLWLLYFEDLSHAEAAAVMNKSSRQLTNLVYRAKSALKSELEKDGFVYEDI